MTSDAHAVQVVRCDWVENHPLSIAYHDQEWGVPVHDDRRHFEAIVLDGFQAGLSWMTILKKRERFRQVFDHFDPVKIAAYDETKIAELMNDAGIVRNRMKIEAAIQNARAFLQVQEKHGSFDAFIWQFVDGRTIVNRWKTWREIPATSPESEKMSKALRELGFRFVGPTICYAYMQAVGMVNDHIVDCFRYRELLEGE